MTWTRLAGITLVLALAACGGTPEPSDGDDGGRDAGRGDAAAPTDASSMDMDVGPMPVDAAVVDGSATDAAIVDSDGGTPSGDAGEELDAAPMMPDAAPMMPDAAVAPLPVVTSVSVASVARGSGITVLGSNLAVPAVTIGGVAQTVASSSATSIRLDVVAASTPLGAQSLVVTTAAGSSAPFSVTVLDNLAVVSASASVATSVAVAFSRAVDPATVSASDFSIAGLTVSAVAVAGATATLTTSAQTPASTYTVVVSGVTDTFGNGLTGASMVDFDGYSPPVPTEFVVVRVGDGTAALSSAATEVFLERRAIPGGAIVSTLAMPVATAGSNLPFTLAGNGSSDGSLSRSEDGTRLAILGFQSVPGTAAVQTVPDPRVVAIVDASDFGASPSVDTSTTIGTVFSTTAPRGAAIDGVDIWVVGGFGGVYTVPLGGSSPTRVSATTAPSSGRAISVFGGQLYYSSGGASTPTLNQLGTGTPIVGDTPATEVFTTTSPYSFTVLDIDPTIAGPDVIYQADDSGGAGIRRFTKSSAGVWSEDAVLGPPVRQASCFYDAPDVVCVGTTSGAIYYVRDTGASTPSSASAMTLLVSAGANTGFRGIAFAPE